MKINFFLTFFYLVIICSCVDIYCSLLRKSEVKEWALRHKKCIVVTYGSKEKYRKADIKVIDANDFSGILYKDNVTNNVYNKESEVLFVLSSQDRDNVTNELDISDKQAVNAESNSDAQDENSRSENTNEKFSSSVLKSDENLRPLDNKNKNKLLNKKNNGQKTKHKKQPKKKGRGRKEDFNFEDFNKKYAHQDKLQLDQIKKNEKKRREEVRVIAKKVFEDDKKSLMSLLEKGSFKEASALLEQHLGCPEESQCYDQLKVIFDQTYSNSITMQIDNISLIKAGKVDFNKQEIFVIYEYIKKLLCKKPLNDYEARQKEEFTGIAEKIEKYKESSQVLYPKKDFFK